MSPPSASIRNVAVKLWTDDGDLALVTWEFDRFTYHFWTVLPAIAPSTTDGPAGGDRKATIHKNLAEDAPAAERRAARPRYLDAASRNGRFHLAQVCEVVDRYSLVAKAYADRTARLAREKADDEAAEIAERKRAAGVELYGALLFARGFLDPGSEVYQVASAALAQAEGRP